MDSHGPTAHDDASDDGDADAGPDAVVGEPHRPLPLPERVRSALDFLPRPVRWAVVGLVGSTLVIAGIAMLVLPGPGLLTVFAGVAILAAEFTWAEILLRRMKAAGVATWSLVRRKPRPGPTP
ncbi:PGPGW domain-containing protein [Pengzhenrongella sicca]|uniref:PGPGW domain-containing protein n=1 Tax=Pengzhenrongella sicca TaxID=2819238 RepID=A0A8A4ZHM5_9MICO|nr:PGPGW domain-containing protein [Pengzhenrongella sicca]QTE30463.1 PGPGW domain-containing protein [Pengzhenrongella sicca]